jgi:hypothetical protein
MTCKESNAVAYFVNNGVEFYFTNFYGNKQSMLYQFYLSAFKIVLSYMPQVTVKDVFPLNVVRAPIFSWLQDFIAPFIQLIKPLYMLNYSYIDDENFTSEISLESIMEVELFGNKKVFRTSQIILKNEKLHQLVINQGGKERTFTCQE